MFRFRFLIVVPVLLALATLPGCQWSRTMKPLTPSQLLSSERSQAGMAALERKDFEEAEKRLSEAVRLNKKDIAHRRNYAEALWRREKYKEALQQLNEAVKRGGADDASLHISLAEKHLFLEQANVAFEHADQAVRLNPNEYKSWALRARAALRLASENSAGPKRGDFLERAKNDYYRALSLSPENRDMLPELALAQMHCGQPEHALATWLKWQDAFQPGGEPIELLQGKAEALVALRRFDEALDCLQAARNREPASETIQRRIMEIVAMTQNRIF